MKRPAFQFYPADWRKDVELRSCSISARGLWIDMLCIAHECEPYGHLAVNGKAMTPAQIAGQVGLPTNQCSKMIDELIANGVARRTDDGMIYSKRMVDDERLRNTRAEGGKHGAEHGTKGAEFGSMGGRPKKARGDTKPPLSDDKKPPLKPPPSSSSSSSSSTSVGKSTRGTRLPHGWDPGPDGLAFAAQLGMANGRYAAELDKFRDYWTAQPGQKGVKADWLATLRNWVRRAADDRPKSGGDEPWAGAL